MQVNNQTTSVNNSNVIVSNQSNNQYRSIYNPKPKPMDQTNAIKRKAANAIINQTNEQCNQNLYAPNVAPNNINASC